jgi:capsular exopolysaccharide synthesis family protein
MELNRYIRLFRKWAWLIILAAVIGAGIAFFVRRSQAETYQAQTKIMIGSFLQAANPQAAEIRTGAELAKTYAALVQTRTVLQATIDALNLDTSPESLGGKITTELIPETSVLILTVVYSDPDLAAAIANEASNQLVLNSPTNLTQDEEEIMQSAREQISALNAQINTANERLNQIGAEIQAIDSVETEDERNELTRLQAQWDITINQRAQFQAALAEFQTTVANLNRTTNKLTIVENAVVPSSPESKEVVQTAILGGLIGLILGAALVLFINYQENTIQSADEATGILNLPVLGTITSFGKAKDSYSERLITYRTPTSPVAETYHTLQANLLFSADGGNRRAGVYVITSPGQGEGKSVTAANLAVTIARSGLRVLLIDADMRQPRQHEILKVENKGHFAELISTPPSQFGLSSTMTTNGSTELPKLLIDSLQQLEIPNMMVITSGPLPEVPAEILGSEYLPEWIKIFQNVLDIDVILFDTPPSLVVADSSILAATTHAHVVLVVEAGQTRRAAARKAKDQFMLIGNPVQGLVVNKANPHDQGFGYGYGYYVSTKA